MAMLFPYLELLASLFILVFAYYIGTRHYDNKTARFFTRFAFVSFFACILTYSFRIAFTLELAAFINRFSASLVAFAFASFAHFALIFTKKDDETNRWELPLLYVPTALLTALFLFTDLMYKRYEIFSYGIASVPSLWYSLFTLQNIAYAAWGFSLFFAYSRTAPQKTEREQSLVIAFGALIPATIGLFTDEIIPLIFFDRLFLPTLVIDFAIMIGVIYWAMRRYSLFSISSAIAAPYVIEAMPDSLLITDLDGRIILLNEDAHKYFHVPKEQILGSSISVLFEDKNKYQQLYSEVVEKGLQIERFEAALCDPLGECLPSFVNATLFRDELGATLGIIFIVRDSRG
jgi:PAS domain S-box-containing protein